jgi:hypothetical protein
VIIAEAGLRIESVGNYDGSDGLRIGDLPEMEVVNGDLTGSEPRVSFSKVPTGSGNFIGGRLGLPRQNLAYFQISYQFL